MLDGSVHSEGGMWERGVDLSCVTIVISVLYECGYIMYEGLVMTGMYICRIVVEGWFVLCASSFFI